MIKRREHIRLRHSLACKRIVEAIDNDPTLFVGLKIPINQVANDRHIPWQSVSFAGLVLAFFVRIFH